MIQRYLDHLTSCWSSFRTILKEGQACASDIRKLLSQEALDDEDRHMICQMANELPPTQDTVLDAPEEEAAITQQSPEEIEVLPEDSANNDVEQEEEEEEEVQEEEAEAEEEEEEEELSLIHI